ncbi:MAG: hypothetical protein ACYDBB_11035 [Armatimonadota bacterium]
MRIYVILLILTIMAGCTMAEELSTKVATAAPTTVNINATTAFTVLVYCPLDIMKENETLAFTCKTDIGVFEETNNTEQTLSFTWKNNVRRINIHLNTEHKRNEGTINLLRNGTVVQVSKIRLLRATTIQILRTSEYQRADGVSMGLVYARLLDQFGAPLPQTPVTLIHSLPAGKSIMQIGCSDNTGKVLLRIPPSEVAYTATNRLLAGDVSSKEFTQQYEARDISKRYAATIVMPDEVIVPLTVTIPVKVVVISKDGSPLPSSIYLQSNSPAIKGQDGAIGKERVQLVDGKGEGIVSVEGQSASSKSSVYIWAMTEDGEKIGESELPIIREIKTYELSFQRNAQDRSAVGSAQVKLLDQWEDPLVGIPVVLQLVSPWAKSSFTTSTTDRQGIASLPVAAQRDDGIYNCDVCVYGPGHRTLLLQFANNKLIGWGTRVNDAGQVFQ